MSKALFERVHACNSGAVKYRENRSDLQTKAVIFWVFVAVSFIDNPGHA
jgi:hypothetical protein